MSRNEAAIHLPIIERFISVLRPTRIVASYIYWNQTLPTFERYNYIFEIFGL